jgi:hypothetical protein
MRCAPAPDFDRDDDADVMRSASSEKMHPIQLTWFVALANSSRRRRASSEKMKAVP